MKECFRLALKADGKVSPNPLVGAVLVNKNNEIVSKGYHKGYGLDHAEVDCIKNYEKTFGKNPDYSELTMYVNLEPCNHYGKTPPCADFIIEKGIKKLVIGTLDPNPKHSGGVKKLENAGIEVVNNVLEKAATELNEVFFKNTLKKTPFIAIKIATTLDGKIATKTGSSKWITSEKSRNYVQKLRNRYDAILTSSKTVIVDNPSLTLRKGQSGQKKLTRIILDSTLQTSPEAKVYNNDGAKVFLICCEESNLKNSPNSYPKNVTIIKVKANKKGKIDLNEAIKKLYLQGVNSILVEAGGVLCGEFLKQNLVDKIYQFVAPKILGDKNATNFVEGFDIATIDECKSFKISKIKNLTPDILLEICSLK